MYPKLLHIYGPIFLQSYGVCIALGIVIFAWLLYKDQKRAALMNNDQFHSLLIMGIISGIIGGRLLFFLTNPHYSWLEFFELWQGGFAVLGSVVGVLLVVPFLLKRYSIPVLPLLDRVAVYAPLLQSISRIGCFLAGCCYGKPTAVSWAIMYTHADCMAPLGIFLHPTQLYSSFVLFFIFVSLLVIQNFVHIRGQLLAWYLLCIGFERFIVDFFRDDQTYLFNSFFSFSDHQLIALAIMVGSITFLLISSIKISQQKRGKVLKTP